MGVFSPRVTTSCTRSSGSSPSTRCCLRRGHPRAQRSRRCSTSRGRSSLRGLAGCALGKTRPRASSQSWTAPITPSRAAADLSSSAPRSPWSTSSSSPSSSAWPPRCPTTRGCACVATRAGRRSTAGSWRSRRRRSGTLASRRPRSPSSSSQGSAACSSPSSPRAATKQRSAALLIAQARAPVVKPALGQSACRAATREWSPPSCSAARRTRRRQR
mmetsp:Transcript_11808/g.27583  ORF Transcript_11808/g.27583 Transcript_11808/m.27583 type:complete len:216 (+) Transcript_11808:553-1200(+)